MEVGIPLFFYFLAFDCFSASKMAMALVSWFLVIFDFRI